MSSPSPSPAAKSQPEKGALPVTRGESAQLRASHPLLSLRDEIDRLFQDFMLPFGRPLLDIEPFGRWAWGSGEVSPHADLIEKDGAFEIDIEVPGMEEKDLDISLANGCLTIKGRKQSATETKQPDYYVAERRFGAFSRSFRLPEGVDQDKISAQLQRGVLCVTMPKSEEARRKERKIQVASK